MPLPHRLLQAATALLYLGPLLAGLDGQGWGMIAAFALVFVAHSVILRPSLWPATWTDLTRSDAAVALAALVASQLLLVTLCFAVGRGMGGVMGLKAALPPGLPLALSVLSIALSRLIRPPHPDTTAAPLLHPLLALPPDTADATLHAHLTAIAAHASPLQIRRAFEDLARTGHLPPVGLRALILHATDPAVARTLAGTAWPAAAFALARTEADRTLAATRCASLLTAHPALAPDCPPPQPAT
jgi:hypothetical protein